MELKCWKLQFKPEWDVHFKKFDRSVQQRILKKLEQMKCTLSARGLHSSNYCVEEAGQYRIAFIQDQKRATKSIHFIGNHKQYDKWCREQ